MGKSLHIQGNKGVKFSQQLRVIDLEKVLLVAIDAAKLHQKALICNYFGDIIEKPFFFSVNHSGVKFFSRKIEHAVATTQAVRLFLGRRSNRPLLRGHRPRDGQSWLSRSDSQSLLHFRGTSQCAQLVQN